MKTATVTEPISREFWNSRTRINHILCYSINKLIKTMIQELQINYRASLICLACAVAFIGTHTAISMCEQYRLALSTSNNSFQIYGIASLASLSLGGVAFSGTQYIVFQSTRLRTSEGAVINVEYDSYLVVGSILISTFLILISILIASQDEYFNKSQTEIMNIFLNRALQTRTIAEIKQLGKRQILFLVCMSSLNWILLGGFIAGGSLCLARYIAVLSVSFPGVVEYNMGLLALSILLSFAGMILLFWLYFRILSVFNNKEILRITCSILGMINIVLSHYIRIFLSKFLYNSEKQHLLSNRYEESGDILVGVLTTAALFTFLLISFALWDLRVWLQDTSTQLYQADRAIISMLNTSIQNHSNDNYSTATNGITETSHNTVQVKDSTMHIPEVVSYVRMYLPQSEFLPVSLRRQISPPRTRQSYHRDDNRPTELPPYPLPEEPLPVPLSPSLLPQPSPPPQQHQPPLHTQYVIIHPALLPILESPHDIHVIHEVIEEKDEEKEEQQQQKEEKGDFCQL